MKIKYDGERVFYIYGGRIHKSDGFNRFCIKRPACSTCPISYGNFVGKNIYPYKYKTVGCPYAMVMILKEETDDV